MKDKAPVLIDKEMVEYLKKKAGEVEGVTVTNLVEMAIEEWIDKIEIIEKLAE